MTWDEYYDKFYDWANSTQISRISQLTSFGSADELCEVATVPAVGMFCYGSFTAHLLGNNMAIFFQG